MKLTETERIILENTDEKYKYIARDEDGSLWLYEVKPIKDGDAYESYDEGDYIYFGIFAHLFKNIKWEDEEPYKFR